MPYTQTYPSDELKLIKGSAEEDIALAIVEKEFALRTEAQGFDLHV